MSLPEVTFVRIVYALVLGLVVVYAGTVAVTIFWFVQSTRVEQPSSLVENSSKKIEMTAAQSNRRKRD